MLYEDRSSLVHLSGYLNACLKELASREGVELFVCHQVPDEAATFNSDPFSWIPAPPFNDDQFSWIAKSSKMAFAPSHSFGCTFEHV